jgi:hypothetical protein
MSRTPMKLILTQEVTGPGAPGDVVEVARQRVSPLYRCVVSGRFSACRLDRCRSREQGLRRPIRLWTNSPGMWMAKPLKVFSARRPWTASAQVAGVADANR